MKHKTPRNGGLFVYVDNEQLLHMSYPDYSILIVETYDEGTDTTTRNAYFFSKVRNAKIAYENEVASGGRSKRVFLFEQPQPTKFKRGDDVPVPTNLDTWD